MLLAIRYLFPKPDGLPKDTYPLVIALAEYITDQYSPPRNVLAGDEIDPPEKDANASTCKVGVVAV